MTLTHERLMELLHSLPAAPPAVRVKVVADHLLPQEHRATRVHIYAWNPFFPWLYGTWFGRLMAWDRIKPFHVVRGLPVMRPKRTAYRLPDGTMLCSREFADELRRQIPPAAPRDPGDLTGGLYSGLFR
jgi:hypothetical protein